MEKAFIYLLFIQLHEVSIALSNNSMLTPTTARSQLEVTSSTTPLFDFEDELTNMSASCMSSRDHEQLWHNVMKHTIARIYNLPLLRCAVEMIGQTEMRAALDFAPRRSWEHRNWTRPSEAELAHVPTIEAYYDLREPRSKMSSLDSLFFLEKNITPGISYLDTRFPFIRAHYRRKFTDIRGRLSKEMIDRKVIDRIIAEFSRVLSKVDAALSRMLDRDDGGDCPEAR